MDFDMKRANSVKETIINDPKYKGLMVGIPELKYCTRQRNCYIVNSVHVRQLVVFYLCRKYRDAFEYLEEYFSFLFEDKKQPICTEWYHDTIRKIIKMVADRPYDEKYIFAKRS